MKHTTHHACKGNMKKMKRLEEDWIRQGGFNQLHYDNIYCWSIYCNNCGEGNRILIKKGVAIPRSIECEECGCQTQTSL